MSKVVCIEGYASIFNEVDQHGDIVLPGAFKGSRGEGIPVLWQHYPNTPLGRVVQMAEDAKGLRVQLEICIDTQIGREAVELIKSNVLKGLSIGYRVEKAVQGEGRVRRKLKVVSLKEISLVTFPAHAKAEIDKVIHT